MSQRIVIMTNQSMPTYVWIYLTDKTAEELADELFTEAIAMPFDIERVIENEQGFDAPTMETYFDHRIKVVGYEGYWSVPSVQYSLQGGSRSGIFNAGDQHGKEVLLDLLH